MPENSLQAECQPSRKYRTMRADSAPSRACRSKLPVFMISILLSARGQTEKRSSFMSPGGFHSLVSVVLIRLLCSRKPSVILFQMTGRAGIIVPTGIATDSFNRHFFKDLVTSRSLVSLFDFENSQPLFEGVHRSFKFCLLTLSGTDAPVAVASFAFFAHHPDDLNRPGTRFTLTPEEITLLNPNTGTCPVFRTRRDAEITLGIYRRLPVLIRKGDPDGNPWGVLTPTHVYDEYGLQTVPHPRPTRSRRLDPRRQHVLPRRRGDVAFVRSQDDPSLRSPVGYLYK